MKEVHLFVINKKKVTGLKTINIFDIFLQNHKDNLARDLLISNLKKSIVIMFVRAHVLFVFMYQDIVN